MSIVVNCLFVNYLIYFCVLFYWGYFNKMKLSLKDRFKIFFEYLLNLLGFNSLYFIDKLLYNIGAV